MSRLLPLDSAAAGHPDHAAESGRRHCSMSSRLGIVSNQLGDVPSMLTLSFNDTCSSGVSAFPCLDVSLVMLAHLTG